MQDDDQLLIGARRFDLDSLATVYDRYSPGLYAYAMRQLGDAGRAEECVAETFSRFLHALKNGGGPRQHLRAYLYRVAHNWISDLYRRQPVLLELDDEQCAPLEDMPAVRMENNGDVHNLRKALHCLTPDQRQVIMLRFIEGWEIGEVAAALDKPTGAVKALQHRAVAALQRLLADDEMDPRDDNERNG